MTHDPVERLIKDTLRHIRELGDANEDLELIRRQWQDIHSRPMQLIGTELSPTDEQFLSDVLIGLGVATSKCNDMLDEMVASMRRLELVVNALTAPSR